jgi:hypothetical protein
VQRVLPNGSYDERVRFPLCVIYDASVSKALLRIVREGWRAQCDGIHQADIYPALAALAILLRDESDDENTELFHSTGGVRMMMKVRPSYCGLLLLLLLLL